MIARTALLLVSILEAKGESPLRPTGVENQSTMDHTKDRYVHFTPTERAHQIVKSGKILADPPHEKFGPTSSFAVSTTYGSYVPRIQTTHYAGTSARTKKLQAAHRDADSGPRADRIRRLAQRSRGRDAAGLSKTLSAVVFSSKTKPRVGFPDETAWDGDVDMHDAKIVPLKTARAMLRKSPHKLGDDHYVVYGGDHG